MRKTLISLLSVLGLTIGSVVVAAPASSTPAYVPTFADFTSATAGTLGTATVTMSGPLGAPFVSLFTGSDFVPPAPSIVDVLAIEGSTPLTISFSTPVTNPALYLLALPPYPASATLDLASTGGTCTWSILSGLTGLTLTGTALSAPTASASGIVLCTGTVSSISMTPSSSTSSPAANYTMALAAMFDPTPPPTPPTPEPTRPTFTG